MSPVVGTICRSALILALLLSGVASAQGLTVPRSALTVKVDIAKTADLTRAEEFLASRQWEAAIDALQRLAEQEGSQLIQLDQTEVTSGRSFVRFVPLRQVCWRRLARTHEKSPDGLTAYRNRVNPIARHWYQQALTTDDRRLMERIVDQFFLSDVGDDALYQLGEIALQRGEFSLARSCWERISRNLPFAEADGNSVMNRSSSQLSYPDTDLNLDEVRARLVLVSILEQAVDRARNELQALKALQPTAEGVISGRRGLYVDLLAEMLEQSIHWPAFGTVDDWRMFGGLPTRNGIARRLTNAASLPRWQIDLPRLTAEHEVVGFGRPRIAESFDGLLSYHPVVVDGMVVWNDAWSVRAHRLADSQPLWGFVDGPDWIIFSLPGGLSGHGDGESFTTRRHLGVPRFSMTSFEYKLFAKLGDPVSGSRDSDEQRAKQNRSRLVGLDLQRQGRLLPGFPLQTDGIRWEFEGAPLTDGSRLLTAMRRSAAGAGLSELHVAAFDLPTVNGDEVRRVWRTKVCGAEPPTAEAVDEYTHCLLTLHKGAIYCNTNMGAVAALDADDGSIRWVVQYPRTTLRPGDPDRVDWHYFRDLNPCLYHEGRIIVAPTDYDHIFALDAMTGELVWQTQIHDAVHSLGVRQEHLIASGAYLYWINANTGIVAARTPQPQGNLADGLARPDPSGYGRGILAGDQIYWPTRDEILVYDQQLTKSPTADGHFRGVPKLVQTIKLSRPGVESTGGNLVVGDGMLIIASADRLTAFGGANSADVWAGQGRGR